MTNDKLMKYRRKPCPCETTPRILHPGLQCSTQEEHRLVRAGPEEGHKDDLKAGAPLLQRQAERAGTVQSGEEKETS